MGYRSDVYIAVKKTDYENLIERVNSPEFEAILNNKKNVDNVRSILKYAKITENCFSDPDYIEIYFGFTKWYDEYYEVKFIYQWLGEIENYDMVIFGEELNDNTVVFNTGLYLFDTRREIVRN